MPATALDLTIEQGATFSQAIALGAGTWDGQVVTAQIRSAFGGQLLATFTGVIASGTLTLSLTATQTAAIQGPAHARADEREIVIGYYDAESVNAGVITRHRQGKVTLSREVST
jgi:hypothetical protein